MSEPLLCLTALVTLRDRILLNTTQSSQFARKFALAGIRVFDLEQGQSDATDEGDAIMQGLSEVNLLESLNGGMRPQMRRFHDSH